MTNPGLDTGSTGIAALIARHQAALWRYLRALGAPADLAEDLLQDTFVVALQRLSEDRGEFAVATFLRRTARHLLLRRRRDGGRRERLLLEAADRLWQQEGADDGGERWLAALRACTAKLSGRAQHAIELFYAQGLSRADTAQQLGMQATGARTLLQRTRALLRACIERNLENER